MTQEELQNLLNGLDKGPLGERSEGEWDRYNKVKDFLTYSNPMRNSEVVSKRNTEEYRKKLSASKKGHKNTVGQKHSEETKSKIAQAVSGSRRAYGRGATYIEVTSGFIGTLTDMTTHFKLKYPSNFTSYLGKPISRGSLKGLHFQIYQP